MVSNVTSITDALRVRRRRTAAFRRVALCTLLGAVIVGSALGYGLARGEPTLSEFFVHARGLIPTFSPYYRYCDDARLAGTAPLHRGEPGYRPELDADGDGIACEPVPSGSQHNGLPELGHDSRTLRRLLAH
ncbi:excalibur calcium-binding domain-containing protein [Novosphingobium sp. 1949]|uniref:Excalibur calcium-binding domain-containing protein n=1 Tax=Novosphingobium organovorum TaxID=2930092 RepID=A0ABT0B8E3_9SPHN|nr:excalibur calcium-binding domain-containing protein [Novosphingobium organovorum]MCJ2181347.1 excalibur calcium-binding domain-containing protein [Novosphingobium organovorum]